MTDNITEHPVIWNQTTGTCLGLNYEVGGSWSVDILETKKGWFVTDMAEAGKSFHWEGCEHAHEFPREPT